MSEQRENETTEPEHPIEKLLAISKKLKEAGSTWQIRARFDPNSCECVVHIGNLQHQAEGKGPTFKEAGIGALCELTGALGRTAAQRATESDECRRVIASASAAIESIRADL